MDSALLALKKRVKIIYEFKIFFKPNLGDEEFVQKTKNIIADISKLILNLIMNK